MKIDSTLTKSIVTPSGVQTVRNSVANSSSPAGSTPSSDEVNLSSPSQLQAVAGSLGAEAPVDLARIEAIKQAISEGRFKINPEAIADSLLNDVRDILRNQ